MGTSQQDDTLRKLMKKDTDVLESLILELSSPVYSLIFRILGGQANKEDIEECVSDVFVDVWNKIESFDSSKGSLKTWIFILAKYKALDYKRKLKQKYNIQELKDYIPSQTNTLDEVLRKSQIESVLEILNSVSSVDKNIFLMKYFYYESMDSIAGKLNLTTKAVENRLRRVRELMKKK
ncbi:sigma-70 family RNA polymerase sigma factor [Paenibacillus sp. Y5S-9]|uniref:sigma-70 family RNA polymerase sigma factor n=1 Tax=Paenibacillus sp. Y5S-9 TaxID=3122489 RepID=UPI0030CD6974